MLLVRRCWFWDDAKEAVRSAVALKFPRPPEWVQEHYLAEYMAWVSRVGTPEKEKGLEAAQLSWVDLLDINPRWDFFGRVEEIIYGEFLLAGEFEVIGQYMNARQRRLRLM